MYQAKCIIILGCECAGKHTSLEHIQPRSPSLGLSRQHQLFLLVGKLTPTVRAGTEGYLQTTSHSLPPLCNPLCFVNDLGVDLGLGTDGMAGVSTAGLLV